MEHSPLQSVIVKRILDMHQLDGVNVQKVLDSEFFHDLPLEAKLRFLEENKERLRSAPKFNWGSVGSGAVGLAAMAGATTLGHQIMTNAGKAGFRPGGLALGAAMGLGALVGGGIELKNSIKEYQTDRRTAVNIDNAIDTLIHRHNKPRITRVDLRARVEKDMVDMPMNYGKTLSTIDFSQID
jgi:hypothetical protein